jgi:hypothetical protein
VRRLSSLATEFALRIAPLLVFGKKKEKPAPQKGRVTFFLAVPPLLDKSTSLLSGVTIVSLKTTGNGRDPAGSYCVKTVQSAAME